MKLIKIAILLSIIMVLSMQVYAQQAESEQIINSTEDQKSPEWPTTIKAVVKDILSKMSSEDKKKIKNTQKQDLIKFHFGWGTGIRNEYGLWKGNKALLKETGKSHPDDASMVIIEAVWKELQNVKGD